MSWPVLSTHKKIQLKKLYCHVFTQSHYGSLLSLILSVQISFQGKIFFFSLYMHRKRKGNFSKPAVFLETLAVLTFFFHFRFYLLSGLTVKMEAAVHGLMPVVLQQGERMKVHAVGWPSLCGSS